MTFDQFQCLLTQELWNMIAPSCNFWEKNALGVILTGLSKKSGELLARHANLLVGMGMIDGQGNLDINTIEYALVNGLQFPIQIGTFKFTREDVQLIMDNIKRGGVPQNPDPQMQNQQMPGQTQNQQTPQNPVQPQMQNATVQ